MFSKQLFKTNLQIHYFHKFRGTCLGIIRNFSDCIAMKKV